MRLSPCARASALALALVLGCAGALPRPRLADPEANARAASLATSVEAVAAGFTNHGRLAAVKRRAAELGLAEHTRAEWIDWWSFQQNVRIEIPGRTPELIYVVAHYDKVDLQPLTAVSVLLNGLLDPLLSPLATSAGAVDNASGVAVALELAAALARQPNRFSYRVLLVGSEESGLRGSRAHVARLPRAEKDAIALAIVVDVSGLADRPNCVIDVSDPAHATRAHEAAARLGLPLGRDALPTGASSDFAPFQRTSFLHDFGRGLLFNLPGGLLPQRSWFTGSHEAPVLFFSACDLVGAADLLGGLLLLPLGRIHGPRDRLSEIDPTRLWEQYAIALRVIQDLEEERTEP
jgi:hypothetical protein